MTSEQAAQLIAQNAQLIELYGQMRPLFTTLVRDLFPGLAVGASIFLGCFLGSAAT